MIAIKAGGRKRVLLVVEDDQDIRDTLVEVLEDQGYQPLSASNGREALDKLRRADPRPRLILLDIMMPVMDGWAFRAAQQGDPELQSIPVIVLTAHTSPEETAEQMEAAGFLRKPVALQALLATVRRYCDND